MLKLLFKHSRNFCQFKYYKQLAEDIGFMVLISFIQVPKINQELGFPSEEKLWLLGYRLVEHSQFNEHVSKMDEEIEQKQEEREDSIPLLEEDPSSRTLLDYKTIELFALGKKLDVLVTDSEQNEVSLSNLREKIYRKYYFQNIYKANSTSKKYKEIRIPEKIAENDLKTKANKILSMVSQGHHNFHIYSETVSEQSEKALKKLCEFIGKTGEMEIKEIELIPATKRKQKVTVERYQIKIDFYEEAKIDYEKVNKKYKRKIINEKVNLTKKSKKNLFDLESFNQESIDIQRSVLYDLRAMRDKKPEQYEYYQKIIDRLEFGSDEGFANSVFSEMKDHMKIGKRESSETKNTNEEDSRSLNLEENENDNDDDILEVTEEELKELRRQMNCRSVEDILEDIEKIEQNKGELDAFQTHRLKNLNAELHTALARAGYQNSI